MGYGLIWLALAGHCLFWGFAGASVTFRQNGVLWADLGGKPRKTYHSCGDGDVWRPRVNHQPRAEPCRRRRDQDLQSVWICG